ncbi:MAG TPA: hypothetical protein VKR31_08700 [Rhizomicrobium sp.]|nr:hypothetical protein [Rhizomicrobium sp.]
MPFALGAMCALAIAAAGTAEAKGGPPAIDLVGWVWADQPHFTPYGSCYTPDAAYSYNSVASGGVEVCHNTTGDYTVVFDGLWGGQAVPGNIQVAAYESNGYCVLSDWTADNGGVRANLYCFVNEDGHQAYADSYFTLFYQGRSGYGNNGLAYLFDDQPSQASYTPAQQYNATGAANTVVHNGAGAYTVTIPGLQATFSDVQVTAFMPYGQYPPLLPGHCNVVSWGSHTGGGTDVHVQCYDNSGKAADWAYTLAYAVNDGFDMTYPAVTSGAWAWANQPESTSLYLPSTTYQYNGFGTGGLTAQKLGTGYYAVYLPGSFTYGASNVQVTAYGNTGDYCNVYGWSTDTVYINCWNQLGNATDTYFDVTFQATD